MSFTELRQTVLAEIKNLCDSYAEFQLKMRSRTQKIQKITKEINTCLEVYSMRFEACEKTGNAAEIKMLVEGFKRDMGTAINVKDASQLPPDYDKFKAKIVAQLAKL